MQKNKKLPYLTELVKKLAPKVGARIIVEPEWGVVAQIIYKNGVVRSLRYLSLDLNHIASADIAKDKDYAKFFMREHGYPVAPGASVLKDSFAKNIGSKKTLKNFGIKYARSLRYPLILKPNSQSQGTDVMVVSNEQELVNGIKKIFKGDRIALIEKYLPGRDYRVVVLDSEVISAYERIPLSVTGDGKKNILALLEQKQKIFKKIGRDTKINFSDHRIKTKLHCQGLTLTVVPKKGERIYLLDNANLSTGGDSVDVTDVIHPDFKKIAIKLTHDMGLRIAGVDLMVTKGDITNTPQKKNYYIIEINAAPGLDHYVTTGIRQKKIVEAMYLKVLKALGKND